MLGSQRSHCHDKKTLGFVDSSEGVGRKGQMSSTAEAGILDGHRLSKIGRLGGYGFQGTVAADDGSNQKKDKMGAGYVNLRGGKKRQQMKVGREEEGFSRSNRPEQAAFVLTLCSAPVTNPCCICATTKRC